MTPRERAILAARVPGLAVLPDAPRLVPDGLIVEAAFGTFLVPGERAEVRPFAEGLLFVGALVLGLEPTRCGDRARPGRVVRLPGGLGSRTTRRASPRRSKSTSCTMASRIASSAPFARWSARAQEPDPTFTPARAGSRSA